MSTSDIHSCSYHCTRPACVLAQRDELRDADAEHRRAQAAIYDALQPASPDRNTWPAEIRDLKTRRPSAEPICACLSGCHEIQPESEE